MNTDKKYGGSENPYLKGKYENVFPKDQIFSVEGSLDSLIPWLEYYYPIRDKKILVFGTGLGGTTVACALNIGNGLVYGVDISEDAIEKTFLRAEAYDVSDKVELTYLKDTYPLPFKDNYFDAVFITDVIEHIVDDRRKYVREAYRVLKKDGLFFITGTPNLLYAKDRHTTGLYFVPWMSKTMAYKYSIFRKKWTEGKNLDYAGRKGTTYWHIKSWLKGFSYDVLNFKANFTSDYLKSNNRLHTTKRKIYFFPYRILEKVSTSVFKIPITAFMPYINHLFIIKK
ncbi:MAG: class I SAM-dependent methyltransferase [Ignavibacteria bacterium]